MAQTARLDLFLGEWPGIAKPSTLEIASLSTTKADGCGFVASAYQIPAREWQALQAREEEFAFVAVPFVRLEADAPALDPTGFMCTEVSPVSPGAGRGAADQPSPGADVRGECLCVITSAVCEGELVAWFTMRDQFTWLHVASYDLPRSIRCL